MKRSVWLRYLLMLLWMAVIFRASATPDLRAVPWVQRLGFLPETLSPEVLGVLEFVLRKLAHVGVYGILAILARWALEGSFPHLPSYRHGHMAFFLTVLYAVSDEWHQSFVPTRHASPVDVGIDAVGAALPLLLIHLWGSRKRRMGRRLCKE